MAATATAIAAGPAGGLARSSDPTESWPEDLHALIPERKVQGVHAAKRNGRLGPLVRRIALRSNSTGVGDSRLGAFWSLLSSGARSGGSFIG